MIIEKFKSEIYKKKLIKELKNFLFSGVLSNLLSFSVYIIINKIKPFEYFLAAFIGQLLALIFSYSYNSRITFNKKRNLLAKFVYFSYYFATIFFVSLTINSMIKIGVEYRISWFISITFISVANFIFLKFFIFKKNIFQQK